MPVKIRLARHGKKAHAFYHIVVADSRSPRDGKYIEKIGTYNPNSQPATIELDNSKAHEWLQKGAQPTDTTRAILSYKGILYREFLNRGVKLGKLTPEDADAKHANWLAQKDKKITDKKEGITSKAQDVLKTRLAAETKRKETKAAAIQAKLQPAPAAEEETPAEVPAAPADDSTPATPEEGQ